MFSSLASLIFGTSTIKEEIPDPNSITQAADQQLENNLKSTTLAPCKDIDKQPSATESKHTIHVVTSSSPSVNGDPSGSVRVVHSNNNITAGKRSKSGKKQRNNQHNRNTNKQQPSQEGKQRKNKGTVEGNKAPVENVGGPSKNDNVLTTSAAPSIAKLLAINGEHFAEDDFNEDDWFFVEKEDDEVESLPRTDSEEEPELSVVEIKHETVAESEAEHVEILEEQKMQELAVALPAVSTVVAVVQQQRRRQQLIDTHALYNGPRHQQQRNYLQRKRNGSVRGSSLSIANNQNNNKNNNTNNAKNAIVKAASVERDVPLVTNETNEDVENSIMTQSLYFGDDYGANSSMDESWFVTPPPCFTSIGPINMVTSPFENLLIEHPSMSVYHSIRSAQSAQESFVNVEIEDNQLVESTNNRSSVQSQRSQAPRIEHYTATQLKQEIFARNAQKCQERRERQNMGRGAIKRMNKVRDGSNKNQRPRRSDLQNSKVLSGANNNRKICY